MSRTLAILCALFFFSNCASSAFTSVSHDADQPNADGGAADTIAHNDANRDAANDTALNDSVHIDIETQHDSKTFDAKDSTITHDINVDQTTDHTFDLSQIDQSSDQMLAVDTIVTLDQNHTGITTPCSNGSGYSLFKFHYGNPSKSPTIDIWNATCSYSYAIGSACNVDEIYPGFGSVSYTSDYFPIFTTSNYLRIRFAVSGLNFHKTTLYFRARGYSSSVNVRIWSPLYGEQVVGPVSYGWTFNTYALDWSNYLYPDDQASLTAIQLYAEQNEIVLSSMEVCVE